MRSLPALATLTLLAGALLAAPPLAASLVWAQDEPASEPGAESPESDTAEAEAGAEAEPKTELRMVRTRRILNTLQAAYDKEAAAESPDAALLDRLEKALADARELLKPIRLAELTEAERKALAEEIAKEAGDDGDAAPEEPEDPLAGWRQRAMDRVFEGADLTEEEEASARPIVAEWFTKNAEARAASDSKAQSDLKRERDKALQKALGKKKARKVINNVNGAMGRWR